MPKVIYEYGWVQECVHRDFDQITNIYFEESAFQNFLCKVWHALFRFQHFQIHHHNLNESYCNTRYILWINARSTFFKTFEQNYLNFQHIWPHDVSRSCFTMLKSSNVSLKSNWKKEFSSPLLRNIRWLNACGPNVCLQMLTGHCVNFRENNHKSIEQSMMIDLMSDTVNTLTFDKCFLNGPVWLK